MQLHTFWFLVRPWAKSTYSSATTKAGNTLNRIDSSCLKLFHGIDSFPHLVYQVNFRVQFPDFFYVSIFQVRMTINILINKRFNIIIAKEFFWEGFWPKKFSSISINEICWLNSLNNSLYFSLSSICSGVKIILSTNFSSFKIVRYNSRTAFVAPVFCELCE